MKGGQQPACLLREQVISQLIFDVHIQCSNWSWSWTHLKQKAMKSFLISLLLLVQPTPTTPLIPLLTGGKSMPTLYTGWFNDQISKQCSASISRAISAGITNMEVQFPPVPNVDEVKFGTPLNQKFGMELVAKDLKVKGGYRPGSDVSRNLLAYSNIYWWVIWYCEVSSFGRREGSYMWCMLFLN